MSEPAGSVDPHAGPVLDKLCEIESRARRGLASNDPEHSCEAVTACIDILNEVKALLGSTLEHAGQGDEPAGSRLGEVEREPNRAAMKMTQEENDYLREQLRSAEARLVEVEEALSRICWTKDCGIDGRNEAGEWTNFAAQERDTMYEIARAALKEMKPDG